MVVKIVKLKVKPRDSTTNFNKLDIGDYFVKPIDLHSLYILTQDKKALHGKDGEGGGGSATDEQIASAVQAYLIENPVEGGMTAEQLNTAISDYLTANAVTNVDEDTFDNMADEWIENIKIAGANLPIIFLEGDMTGISKENAVPMKMRFVSQFKSFEETCTLKYQGTSSMSYPKKNFTMKLDNKHGVGWGKQKKYCLKANYIDHSHARNIVSARLWSQVVSSRADYAEMPEPLQASPNNGAIDGFPIRVYLNEVYQGLYTMNIPKGSWQFNMDDTNENHCILCGENDVSGCFRANANIDSTDWSDELHDVVPESIVTRWNEVINFIKSCTIDEMKANLNNYIDVHSAIDYFIFGYCMTGLDNFAKNQIYYTYDGQKFYASMYDLDSTWGLHYNGTPFLSYDYEFENLTKNNLYYKLKDAFKDEIKIRYSELRNSILSYSNIIAEFEKFMSAITTEQYNEDLEIYTNIPSGSGNNIKQLRNYVRDRLSYVDAKLTDIPLTAMSVSDVNILIGSSTTIEVLFTPSNANNYSLLFSCDNDSIATVDGNGVVTGLSEGSTTITVTDIVSGLVTTSTVTISQPSENATVFYGSKLEGVDIWSNGNKYTITNDISSELPYLVAGYGYVGEGVIDDNQASGTVYCLIFTSEKLTSGNNKYEKLTSSEIPSDFEYECYYALADSNKQFTLIKSENPKVIQVKLDAGQGTYYTLSIKSDAFQKAKTYANYDMYTDSTETEIGFAKNYEQSDYE